MELLAFPDSQSLLVREERRPCGSPGRSSRCRLVWFSRLASGVAAQTETYDTARSFIQPWEIHPMLVHYPIAFLLSAVALDLFVWWRERPNLAWAVRWLLLTGVVA